MVKVTVQILRSTIQTNVEEDAQGHTEVEEVSVHEAVGSPNTITTITTGRDQRVRSVIVLVT